MKIKTKIIIKHWPQHLIPNSIGIETRYGLQGKRFESQKVTQHPGNDIGSDLLYFCKKQHFPRKVINLIHVTDSQEPSMDRIQDIIEV
ncbi:MAG: hypothetical protein ABSD71_03335 [Bacteroidales bacterium]